MANNKPLNRRDFLKNAALTGGLIAVGPLLGCVSKTKQRDPSSTDTVYGGYYVANGYAYHSYYGGYYGTPYGANESVHHPYYGGYYGTYYGGYYGSDGTAYACEYGKSYYQPAYYGYAYPGGRATYGLFEGGYACPAPKSPKSRR